MKTVDIRKKTAAELTKEADELRAKLAEMRLKLAAGEVKGTHEHRLMRRNLARVLTIRQEIK